MNSQQLKQIAYSNPFRPYRVTLKSGEQIDVQRRFRTTISDPLAVFGYDDDPQTGRARKMRLVYISQIDRVEQLQPTH
jgi:hypothetical protein